MSVRVRVKVKVKLANASAVGRYGDEAARYRYRDDEQSTVHSPQSKIEGPRTASREQFTYDLSKTFLAMFKLWILPRFSILPFVLVWALTALSRVRRDLV